MQSKAKQAVSDFVVYGVGEGLTKAVGFLMIPVYTAVLTPAEYGTFSLLLSTAVLLAGFFLAGMQGAMFRFYHDRPGGGNTRAVATALLVVIGSSAALVVAGQVAARSLGAVLTDGHSMTALRLALLYAGILNVETMLSSLLRLRMRSVAYAASKFLILAMQVAAICVFLLALDVNEEGIFAGNLFGLVAGIPLLVWLNRPDLRARPDWALAGPLVRYGLPIALSGVCGFLVHYADRFMLKHFMTFTDVGIYNLGYQFGMVFSLLLIAPLKRMWGPLFLEHKDDADIRGFVARTVTAVMLASFFLATALSLFAREIIALVAPPGYAGAAAVVPFIAFTYAVWTIRPVIEVGIVMARKTHLALLYTGAGALANIALNALWIPRYGIGGAVAATCAAFTLMTAMDIYFNQRLFALPLEVRKLLLTAGIAIAFWLLSVHFGSPAGVRLALLFAYLPVLLLCRVVSAGDVRGLVTLFAARRGKD